MSKRKAKIVDSDDSADESSILATEPGTPIDVPDSDIDYESDDSTDKKPSRTKDDSADSDSAPEDDAKSEIPDDASETDRTDADRTDIESIADDDATDTEAEDDDVGEPGDNPTPMTDFASNYRRVVIVINRENYMFSDKLSQYEVTELISIRIAQIETNGIAFTDITGLSEPKDMAIKELREKKCPLIIRRERGEIIFNEETGEEVQYVEDWDPNECRFDI